MDFQIESNLNTILEGCLDPSLFSSFCTLLMFVKVSTKNFDDSHDYIHAIKVTETTFNIYLSDITTYIGLDPLLLLIIAMLHDVCDSKYKELSITNDELTEFILSIVNKEMTTEIMKIINSISYSKQIKI